MPKRYPLVDHLWNPANQNSRDPLTVLSDPRRLTYQHEGNPGDWNTVANYIFGPRPWPVMWFPDTNVAILDQAAPVWEAFRKAGLGSPDGVAVLSGVVEGELNEWLADPYRNPDRARAIRDSLRTQRWVRAYRVTPNHPLNPVLLWYTHLLGFRRQLACAGPDGRTPVGTDARDKSATMNAIRAQIGPRAQGLAKKGRQSAESSGLVNISDEMHCVMMILYALTTGRDVMMLTADLDNIEIFFKAQWLVDTHYRGWLTARLITEGRYGKPVREFDAPYDHFEGPVTLYKRYSMQMHDVLPSKARGVYAGVLYVAPDGTLQRTRFRFETAILGMIETRNRTGRCTDLFGDRNIHIDLGPLTPSLDDLYLGVGKDTTISFTIDGIESRIPSLDLIHSVNCQEQRADGTRYGNPPLVAG